MYQLSTICRSAIALLCCAGIVVSLGCGEVKSESEPLKDAPIAQFQQDLLELAFDSASSIPEEPHIKDKSKAQQAVVTACLELDQPARAISYIKQISNWRQGAAYADVVWYLADKNPEASIEPYLTQAAKIAEGAEDWRRDRIRVRLAQALTLLGREKEAAKFNEDIVDSEAGKVAETKATQVDAKLFDAQVSELDGMIALNNFDILRNALIAYVRLFDRFYGVQERRDLAEEKVISSWGTLPITLRLELLMEMTKAALGHDDKEKALAILKDAREMLGLYEWSAEQRIPLAAQIAELRFQAGETTEATNDFDTAYRLYESDGDKVVNIYRGNMLRPLAEAYQRTGNKAAALKVYKRVIEEGIENPNSRPRAEDLTATCCSMAVSQAAPDAEIWVRMKAIREEFAKPW